MFDNRFLASGAAVIAIMAAAPAAYAQTTSATLSGTVTDNNGAPVAGATVTIRHEPTGSTSVATTSSNGVFFEPGLRVGGPYTISVASAEGTVDRTNIRLQPGSGNSLNLSLYGGDEIVVSGTAASAGIDLNGGVGSVFSADDILSQPSAERDLIATLVRDPLAFSNGEGNLSVAGTNPRFNALAIDGSLQQDDFGLSSSTYATARSPISLDVIESASVAATDYSVTASGFTGGLVNVVTKSGTNEFHGNLYYARQDEDFFGNTAFDQFVDVPEFTEEEYGFTLGGPLIKDKLFFFVSYDEFESASGSNFTVADENDAIDPALFDFVNDLVEDTYGFDLGGRPLTVANPVISERFLLKLDWNINDDHRASFTYQDTSEAGVSGVGNTTFTSAYYDTPTTLEAYTFQLNSDWTADLSTEFRVNFKDYARLQNCRAGDTIGEFEIELTASDLVGTAGEGLILDPNDEVELVGGCDRFRQGNTFEDERLQIFGAANYTWNDHLFTFGFDVEDYELANLFAQRSTGEFVFESVDDIINRTADVAVQLPDTGNRDDILAAWGFNRLALFAGDKWQITPDFRLDYGIRYERIFQDDQPQERTFFEDRYGFSNTQNLDGLDLIMPRVGFEWNPLDRTTITGGFGLYAGGDPKVWTSNAFTPPVFFASASNLVGVDPTAGTPQALLDIITANDSNAPGPIDVISSDFETPSDWRASVRWDQSFDLAFGDFDFGSDYQASFQLLYSTVNQGFRWENLAQTELADTAALGVAPDGRPIYADLDDLGINNAIALTNFDEGNSLIFSASLGKDYDNGFGFFASYAYQDVENTIPGTSSRGVSNFRAIIDSDRNNPSVSTSEFQVEHAFKINLSYEDEFFGDLTSRFNLFGQIFSGEPFSYTFDVSSSNALFGRQGDFESPFDNDLLYIPTISGNSISDSRVVVGAGFDEAGFIEYVQATDLEFGAIAERHNDESNWNQRWDFQWQQDLPTPSFGFQRLEQNQLKFIVDVENVANLLNDEWGTQFGGPGFDTRNIVQADLVSVDDVALNGVDGATALTGDAPRTTCTSEAACVYRFRDFDADETSFESLTQSVYEVRFTLRYDF